KHADPTKPQNWTFEEGQQGPWEAMYSARSIVTYGGMPAVPRLTEKQGRGPYHLLGQPSPQIIITPPYMNYRQYVPDGPGKLRLIENWTFPGSTVARDDFKNFVPDGYYHKYSEIIREDLTISPVVQQGMRSGAYRPGRYSLEEFVTHRIAHYVIDRVVGPPNAAEPPP